MKMGLVLAVCRALGSGHRALVLVALVVGTALGCTDQLPTPAGPQAVTASDGTGADSVAQTETGADSEPPVDGLVIQEIADSDALDASDGDNAADGDGTAKDAGESTGDTAVETAVEASPTAPPCIDSCAKAGSTACGTGGGGESGVTTCVPGAFGCLAYSPVVGCPSNSACADGACQKSCPVGGCSVLGERKCGVGQEVFVCTDSDGDGCPNWTPDKPCGGGLICQLGLCALICPAGCPFLGATQCSGVQLQTCSDSDGDGCATWAAGQACPTGSACAAGKCQLPCTDTCGPKGTTECATGGVKLCGDADGDGCLAWNPAVACPLTEQCAVGACVPKPPAVKLAINEIAIWPNPAANAPVEVFVELAGPAATDLAGWTLAWVSPAGEVTVTLAGKVTAAGFFVTAHPKATAVTLAKAQHQDVKVLPPVGALALRLRFGKTLVDTVGWGVIASEFVGEAAPATPATQLQSIGRNAKSMDTDNNASDFMVFIVPTPGMANTIANGAPKAVLACPLYGGTDVALAFDATGTVDPESQWQTITLDFGDKDATNLPANLLATHSYKSAGNYVATLVATDAIGQSTSASCDIHIAQAGAPTVSLLRPASGLQVVAGSKIAAWVTAQAAPTRQLVKLELRVADLTVDETPTTASSWQTTLTVPVKPNGTWIRVEARGTDDLGQVGVTLPVLVKVQDDVPVARFVGRPLAPTLALLDARGSTDTETAGNQLAFRWDLNADGNWDTGSSPQNRWIEKAFAAAGKYQVKVEVKDAAGQVAVQQRELVLGAPVEIKGAVQTATWSGIVRLTGSTTVAAGQTLTIAAGTTVQVDFNDSDGDGAGDVVLDVQGKLVVQGLVDKPVVFAPLASDPTGVQWAGLKLVGKGSTVVWADISWAMVGVEIAQDAALADVVVRSSAIGLQATAGSKAVATRLVVLQPWQHGMMVAAGGGLTAAFSQVYGAGLDGVRSLGAATLSDGVISGSNGAGIVYSGLATGSVTRTAITGSQWEGVRLEPAANGSPNVALQRNSILGNAKTGARAVVAIGTEAATLAADVTTNVAPAWPAPPGLYAVQVAFTEADVNKVVDARLRDGPTGPVLIEWKTPFSGWVVLPKGVSLVVAEVSDNGPTATGKLQLIRAVYDEVGSLRQASIANLVAVDARWGWWGQFPAVLDTIAAAPAAINVQGFACQPYDNVWVRSATCIGADVLPAGTTGWGGSMVVTGDIAVAANQTLTLVPGARLWMAPLDANADKIGDLGLTVSAGTLKTLGTAERPVQLLALAAGVDRWRGVREVGASSLDLAGLHLRGARTGLLLEAGKATLTALTITDSGEDGVQVKAVTALTVKGLTVVAAARDGVRIEAGAGLNLATVTLSDCGNDGLAFAGPGAPTATVNDLSAIGNARAGLWVAAGAPQVSNALLSKNGWGARLHGPAGGAILASIVQANQREGILVGLVGAITTPTTVIHGSNITGNCTAGCGAILGPGPIVKTDAGFKGNKLSAAFATAPPVPLLYAVVAFTELDAGTYVSAQLRMATATGAVVWASGVEVQAAAVDLGAKPPTAVVGEVIDTSSNYHGTLTVVGAFGYGDAVGKQAAVFSNGAAVDWTGNWWGNPVALEALTVNRPQAVNVGGALGQPAANVGPNKP
ncbi:MAG: PKD domain-containing protein [Myxococcales bacterium]|nr:PKD domain-containing protein [Myxococcales bacterium]